jgi:O-antigen/teichoic acid export membrane protein
MNNLRTVAAFGIKWTSAAMFLTSVFQLLQLIVLARLLTSDAFGLTSIIVVVAGCAQALGDVGIGNAIIQRQEPTKKELSSLYWISILLSVLLCLVLLLSTPIVVHFYQEPRLTKLVYWYAPILIITAIGQQFQILLQKELQFNSIAKIDVVSAGAGALTAVISAINEYEALSLIWGQLATAVVKSLLSILYGGKSWWPTFRCKYADLKSYARFSLYQTSERCINYFSANVDYLIIGRLLGPEVLGVYSLAYQLVVLPLSKINPIITNVAYPLFAKKQSDNSVLCRAYLEVVKLVSFICLPALLGLAIVAPAFIPVVYGSQWSSMVPLVQMLSLLGIFKALGNPNGLIYLSKGRVDIGFMWNVVVASSNTVVFWFAAKLGINFIVLSYVVLSALYFLAGPLILRFIISLNWRAYLSTLAKPTSLSICMGLFVHIVFILVSKIFTSATAILIIVVCLGIFIYALLMIRFERLYIAQMISLIVKKKD